MGRPGPTAAYADITPAREHLLHLIGQGISRPAIAKLSGLSLGTIREYERVVPTSDGVPPKTLIHRMRARRILAIEHTQVPGSQRFVDAASTVRRLQALVVAGYSRRMVADALGTPHLRGRLDRATVLAATAAAVADFYEQHASQEPTYRSATQRGHAREAQAEAEALGWLGPWDWDDVGAGVLLWDTEPEPQQKDAPTIAQIASRVPCSDVRPHIRALLTHGWSRVAIADAAGVDSETVRAVLGEKLVRGRRTLGIRRVNAERILAIPLAAVRLGQAAA